MNFPLLGIAQGFSTIDIHEDIQGVSGYEGSGVSFADFDNDGWDDVSICSKHVGIQLFKNLQDEGFEPIDNPFGLLEYDIKMITWIDVDNDGDADAMITCYQGPIKLFERTGEWEFEDITESSGLTLEEAESFGHNWGDFDRDGFLDLYVSNYNYFDGVVTNYLYRNNGDNTFTNLSEKTAANDGSNFTLMSVFIDYDDDGWEDLFVANDRYLSANSLYRNVEGTFEDVSEESGINAVILSMSNSWADFDRDGDFDVYVSNNPEGNRLEKNNGDGTFTNVAPQVGATINDFSWSATWIDYNNNGWEDLHVCVEPFWNQPGLDRFLINDSGTFVCGNEFGFSTAFGHSHSSAFGDYNNDGFPDLLVSKYGPDVPLIYKNNGIGGNYVKVRCDGSISNRDGIGCKISAWTDEGLQLRYTHGGESYLSQHSRWEIIGVGDATAIDSLQIRWPSGIVDTWYNLEVNQNYPMLEGSSHAPVTSNANELYFLCEGDSLSFHLTEGELLHWSTGSNDSLLVISEGGTYHAVGIGPLGLSLESEPFTVVMHETTEFQITTEEPHCLDGDDGSISCEANSETPLSGWHINGLWYTEAAPIFTSGTYNILVVDANGCSIDTIAEVHNPPGMTVETIISIGDCSTDGLASCELIVEGHHGTWTDLWENDLNPQALPPGVHNVSIIDDAMCSHEEVVNIPEPVFLDVSLFYLAETFTEPAMAWLEINSGTAPFSVQWSNGATESTVNNLQSDVYSVTVSDAGGCFWSESFVITSVEESLNTPAATAYPNPCTSHLKVKGDTNDLYNLYDLRGSLISVPVTFVHGEAVLDVSGLPAGSYLLEHNATTQFILKF